MTPTITTEPAPEVTRLLNALGGGDAHAAAELLPLVYDELRKLARVRMNREALDQTLEPTALVHEVYMRLVGEHDTRKWDNRGHFFASAAHAMRRILIERARSRARLKRGGAHRKISLDDSAIAPSADEPDPLELLAIDEVLKRLERYDKRKFDVVMLRFYGGLNLDETADALGVCRATVKNDWTFARAWCMKELADHHPLVDGHLKTKFSGASRADSE